MATISVNFFAKDNGLSKATVLRRCKAMGIETREGLAADAVLALRREFELDKAPQIIDGELLTDDDAIVVSGNCGVPAIPTWDTGAHTESRDIAQVRQGQGQRNLETYIAGLTANYIGHRVSKHLAGIDAAFANVAMQTAHLADQNVKGE